MKNWISYIVLAMFLSCNHEPPKLKLSREEKVQLDTLFKNQVPTLNAYIDSICQEMERSQYQNIKDSIIAIRLQEIDQIAPGK